MITVHQEKLFKWIATISIILGAIFVSISTTYANMVFPFVLFLIGHIIWGIFATIIKEKQLFWLNVGFIPLDFYAIYLRI